MIVELHLLQNVAPSCLNRDDANAPKDCDFGGYRRARISSQCIKRSIREEFRRKLPENTGLRSKLVVDRLAEHLAQQLPDKSGEEINKMAGEIIAEYYAKPGKNENESSVLVFFDDKELKIIAEEVADFLSGSGEAKTPGKGKKKDDSIWKNFVKASTAKPVAFDIALFGRMLASRPEGNIDGACQVAHALSTNRVTMEFDFFTAVDDLQTDDQSGAGMMGTVGFNSSCFYRYAVIDVDSLARNLQGDRSLALIAIKTFIEASFVAMPTGKQHTFAAHNLPSFGYAVVRENNIPWSLANAFEKPIRPTTQKGLVESSVEALLNYWQSMAETYAEQQAMKGGAILLLSPGDSDGLNNPIISRYRKNNLTEFLESVTRLIAE